ncbi:mannose-6-phosphate isomerase, class I [Aerococcaceae bacterium DSM 111020]|nr:mannose-6-phosphate isomerase, class I [Aerococcaceae bacterium DSM 111020]
MEPIFLKPAFQEKIWGGQKLQTEFGMDIPSDKTGEAWIISSHPNGKSTVISPAKYEGLDLEQLYSMEMDLFGPNQPKKFPLLVKIIDADKNLSVQVHPDDDYAQKNEGLSELGKNECWYIMAAEPDAKIIYGHQAKTKQELINSIENKQFKKLFKEIPVKEGDFFDVPAGTIHAIGEGITILEIQQSSDTTYRVYDYNRKDAEGNKRDLHIDQTLDVTTVPHEDSPHNKQAIEYETNRLIELVQNDYFSVYKLSVEERAKIKLDKAYYLVTVISGKGSMELDGVEYPLELADSFILPYGEKELFFKGEFEAVMSKVN